MSNEDKMIAISDVNEKLPLRLRRLLEKSDVVRFGYVRVSTKLKRNSVYVQTFDSQLEPIINKYNVKYENIFCDRSSGVKERKSLEKLCEIARPGDEIVVFRLDRLGRSAGEMITRVQDLNKRGVSVVCAADGQVYSSGSQSTKILLSVYAMLADLEREALIERVKEGQAIAYSKHPERFGRPRKVNDDKANLIISMWGNGQSAISIGRALGLSRGTVYNVLRSEKVRVGQENLVEEE